MVNNYLDINKHMWERDEMSVLQELAVKHPYYCSESNYYSNEGSMEFATMTDFLDVFEDADIDYNLCFRWDVKPVMDDEEEPTGSYRAEVFLMLQRKGIFRPCSVESITEDEAVRFKTYIVEHFKYMMELWAPLSGGSTVSVRRLM